MYELCVRITKIRGREEKPERGKGGVTREVIILHFRKQNRDQSLLTRLKATEATQLSLVMCHVLA